MRFRWNAVAIATMTTVIGLWSPAGAETLAVEATDLEDLKAVYATVRSKDVVEARVRTPGTVAKLSVTDGQQVEAGQVLAMVADEKLALQQRSVDARIVALASSMNTAKTELDRALTLRKRNVIAQARLDEVRNAFEVAANTLKAAEAERAVIEKQIQEGEVLAPAPGRIIRIPVTVGSVVMGGESIATIAANAFLLRLELPERNARFIAVGDRIDVAERGLAQSATVSAGSITLVYPELQNGRVVADAEVSGLGDYFVGERVLVWISAGKRRGIVIPKSYITRRGSLDYVRIDGATGPIDIVVELGQERRVASAEPLVEILSGLKAGDVLVAP